MTGDLPQDATIIDEGGASPSPSSSRVDPGRAAIRLTGLTKRFGLKVAVDNVSLTVERGSAFGLIGPNGAGKTTTFSVVAGYLRPTSGSVEVLGLPPTAVDSLRGRLGVLPQDAGLPANEPVGEFLVHLARLQGISGQKAVAMAYDALADVAGTPWWRQRCGSLSHGMAKRVGLAQAFLGQPEVVLLDEPTAGLDPRIAFDMRQYIKAKRGKTAIVISSHNLQELEELCDAAAILDRGRIVVAGAMADLTASNEEVRVVVGQGSRRGTEAGTVPMQALRDIPDVRAMDFDDEALVLTVAFDRTRADAETIIGRVLTVLLGNQVRISGVVKGRGLEQRVRDLT
jgi:ABC-type multidrug transport system ATPase subunit